MMKFVQRPGLRSTFKAATIAVLLLLLLIPLAMIRTQVSQREYRAQGAADEVIAGAGGSMEFIGPLLIIPYERQITEFQDGKRISFTTTGEVSILPRSLSVNGNLDVAYRYRGIYRVPVYSAFLEVHGNFQMPETACFPDGAVPRFDHARLAVGMSEMRGIREVSPVDWNGDTLDFTPDSGRSSLGNGISTVVPVIPDPGGNVDFSWTMEVNGGGSVSITPLGRDSVLSLTGNWPSPSFSGAILPDERELTDEGFSAGWRVPEVSRPIRSCWDSSEAEDLNLGAHALRVELLEPVSAYSRTERSVKYGALFLLIPFVVLFLFETLGRLRIHPVQYLLAGAADVMFYLLLLALSEHLGFNSAYLIASTAVTVLISLYTLSISRGKSLAYTMPPVLAGAYIWLWVTLKSEDYALLIGSVGLFVIVGALMVLTRKVDWYSGEVSGDGPDPSPEGKQSQPGKLDMLTSERNTDDGDRKDDGRDDVVDREFPAEE